MGTFQLKMEIPNNFCGLAKDFSDYKKSKAVILPVPYDGTRGWISGEKWKKFDSAKGPEAIISCSPNLEFYDDELDVISCEAGIHTLNALKTREKPELVIGEVYTAFKKLIKDGKFPVMLGGEHSISSGAVKALKEKYSDLSVLQLDAHTDLRDSWEGTKYSHACVMARVIEICPAVQVGIRARDYDEKDINKENIFFAKDIVDSDDWMDEAVDKLSDNVYITFDLDAFDPSIMPSTGTPEPGGLQWYQTLRFLRKVFAKKNVVGFDVVELAPIDNMIAPDFLAAKLVYKIIGYKFFL